MKRTAVNVPEVREIARESFCREYSFGHAEVTAIALREEKSGEVRLLIEVPNAQILKIPDNLGELLQGIGFSIAALCSEHKVMVRRRRVLGLFEGFGIWKSCCQILNSLDLWVRSLD